MVRVISGGPEVKLHRAFGCYGILTWHDDLIVIRKHGGPYTDRFDLPGGSLDGPEDLAACVLREVHEETGVRATIDRQLGTVSFDYPWIYKHWDHNQHLAVFYRLQASETALLQHSVQFIGQDSLGAQAVKLTEFSEQNASPLVLWARDYLQTGAVNLMARHYPSWKTYENL